MMVRERLAGFGLMVGMLGVFALPLRAAGGAGGAAGPDFWPNVLELNPAMPVAAVQWASGGWMSDSRVDGNVGSGTQQQWISRNSEWGSWTGSNWNMVFVGVPQAPAGEWPAPPYTKVAQTPIVREKPFLVVDGKGQYG